MAEDKEKNSEETPEQVSGNTEETLEQTSENTEKTPEQVSGNTEETLEQTSENTEEPSEQASENTEVTPDAEETTQDPEVKEETPAEETPETPVAEESGEANDTTAITEPLVEEPPFQEDEPVEEEVEVEQKPLFGLNLNEGEKENRNFRKERVGKITSDKMDKTITVIVERRLKHPIYGKFLKQSKKFLAHDEKEEGRIGDTVKIMECRPLSKRKRWRLIEILERAK